jgi:polyhydroxybutyrate depolymerase
MGPTWLRPPRPTGRPNRWALARSAMALALVAILTLVGCTTAAPWARTAAAATSGGHRSAGCSRTPSSPSAAPGHDTSEVLTEGAVTGSYQLSVPASYRPHRPVPLILLFYGFADDPTSFTALTGLPARGSAGGAMVVVPHTQGAEAEWQFDGTGTDATFVDTLVHHLEATYCVATDAVDAAGFSAGAAFAIVYACSHRSQVAAVATVAVEFLLGCTRPLPILAFHGTADQSVPYQDGAEGISLPGIKVSGTQRNMAGWARLDGCRPTPVATRIASAVTRQQWTGCVGGMSVVLYTVAGGPHAWPGADPRLEPAATRQIDATRLMLSFFAQHGSVSVPAAAPRRP